MTESIGHYRIGVKLGQGAMGAVYRATDTKLGRDVAIKVLTSAVADGSAGLSSIAREAKVLAALNHPNIAAIYGIEDHAIVMELVKGPTLADRIARGASPLDEALAIARQLADALAAAHDKGIVHRDLKPGNIKLTADGTIKLLDFGLATPAMLASPADDAATIAPGTASAVGMIVGTPAYMAPEQARGNVVDKRADIWAFGVVLYEMLTGSRLFGGDSTTDILAAIVREEPDLTRVPASVRPLLRRCLEKDPRRRLRDIGDAMLLLESGSEATAAGPKAESRHRAVVPLGAIATLALALAALAYVHFRESAPTPDVVRFTTRLPPNLNFTGAGIFVLSPDGRRIAFPAIGANGQTQLWIQSLDSLEPRAVPGVDLPQATDTLFWSPDSRSLAFATNQPTPQLKRVDAAGGPVQVMATLPGFVAGGSWAPDGSILLGSLKGILRMPPGGGTPVLATQVDEKRKELAHIGATLLPDGKHFVYSRGGAAGSRGIFVGSLDVAADAQSTTPLMTTDFGASFALPPGSSRNGWLLFVRDGTLLAQPFDASTQTLSGEPMPVVEDVGTVNGTGAGGAYYSLSRTGVLAYRTGAGVTGMRQLAWVGRDGRPTGASAELSRYGMLKVSPDGTRVATSRQDPKDIRLSDIWVTDIARDSSIRLTFGTAQAQQPVWSPDGTRIAWTAIREGAPDSFYRKAADGSGADELLYTFDSIAGPLLTDWTSDGRFLVFSRRGDIFALPVGPDSNSSRQPIPVVQTPANERAAYVSPDRKWVVYLSDESGREEIYVQPFAPGWDGAKPTGGKTLVSHGALGLGRWRGDGKELLFISGDGTLMAAPVSLTPSFTVSAATPLFTLPRELLAQGRQPGGTADVSRDHQRVFLITPPPDARQGINVVLNWQAGLKR